MGSTCCGIAIASKPTITTYVSSELQAALEQCVMAAIHKKVWSGLCELYAMEDRNTLGKPLLFLPLSSTYLCHYLSYTSSWLLVIVWIIALLEELQNMPMTAMGVRPEIVCSPMKAIRRLSQINICGTPFDKFNCLAVHFTTTISLLLGLFARSSLTTN
jgi:hypothetical protein